MKSLTVTELRKNMSRVLDLIDKGETACVLRHGKAVAKIVPADLAGGPRPAWKRPVVPLVMSGASLSQAVLEERG
jgi:antitoxin (DNA-binding transcriptional repressor) of toxin-antitoxin stability system